MDMDFALDAFGDEKEKKKNLKRDEDVAALRSFRSSVYVSKFTTLQEYLFKLKHFSIALQERTPRTSAPLLVFAAAVSDFYVPSSQMNEHKIQSSSGPLVLELSQVPKILGFIRAEWAPKALCVSFKLETDESIVLSKARGAIAKYDMSCVVANQLDTRYDKVTVVSLEEERVLTRNPASDEKIEASLVAELARRHAERQA